MGSLCRARLGLRRRSLSTQHISGRPRAWPVVERRGAPGVLHVTAPETGGRRLACVCLPLEAAVVIGSAQPDSEFDHARLARDGVGIVRRRSGGGAVLVAPGGQVWLDVFLPSGDPLFETDVGKSFHWLGEVFAKAIASSLGHLASPAEVEVHRGSVQTTPWSKVLCYAGLGAGEVTVAGRKVVGMSQRRERSGSWIHSMALLGERAPELADLLSGSEAYRASARTVLEGVGLLGATPLVGRLTEEVLSRLP